MRVKALSNNTAEIQIENGNNKWTVFISYETPVAAFSEKMGYFRTSENHSRTTSEHISKWLNGVNAKIEDQVFFDTLLVSRL